MSLLIISHSYISPENQKNIAALRRHINVRVAVPDWFKCGLFQKTRARILSELNGAIRIFKAIHLPRSQYLLRPLALDLAEEPTEVINVEYDPWSVMFWQALAARKQSRRKSKIVCTIKNNTYTSYSGVLGALKRSIARKGIAAADHFLACSQRVASLYQQQFSVPREKMTPCYHLGIDAELFRPRQATKSNGDGMPLVIGYCGRFDPDKGVMDLIEAVRRCRKGQNLQLHLLGSGLLERVIEQAQKEAPWIKSFQPVPHERVPEFLQGLDLFVLPSRVSLQREEHDAHALAEAMAVGLPCIGTNSGIIPELIGDGTGMVVPANSSEGIAGAVERLAQDRGLRISLGEKGRNKVLADWAIDALARKKAGIFKGMGCN